MGILVFFLYQYGKSLVRLTSNTSEMDNHFSTLAQEQYFGFLVRENLLMLLAYVLLTLAGAVLIQPVASWWTGRSKFKSAWAVALRALILVSLLHHYFTLRLIDTRPYFLPEGTLTHSYYGILDFIPAAIKPVTYLIVFHILPIVGISLALIWHIHRRGKRGWIFATAAALIAAAGFGISQIPSEKVTIAKTQRDFPNIIILGSDSLRGDKLGVAGYVPSRSDGLAAAGVSPVIDALAKDSIHFENCYSPIASTLESGTSLMSAQYPQTHGIRQMYPNRETVEATKNRIVPLAKILREQGYDTAAIGDWCAGYYELMPLGFEHISVSNFDNFKIYMSQAVVMAHFVVPLYFDNPIGYKIFPQLGSFAQFVTPEVVTQRVEKRLEKVGKSKQPFFWHVFYSCNHLPYRNPEPYRSMFTDPAYQGRNKNGVDFDINSFISSTDLESKWKMLPPHEVDQIRALYDGCTRQFDDCVARVLASLKQNGLSDNTIVIITADHGDDLYEPGVTLGHGLTFNGGLQANHVPMIFHVPGATPRSIPETVRLIDVIPTLADLAGVSKPAVWQGKSFAGWIKGNETPEYRPFYGETGFPFIQFSVPGVERPKLPPMDELTSIREDFNYQFVLKDEYQDRLVQAKQRCLKTRFWKLVCTPTADGDRHFALFHLPTDPHGERDVATSRPEILTPMRVALESWIDRNHETSIAEIFPNGEPE
jgi:arylsulfatase A-like enzyme